MTHKIPKVLISLALLVVAASCDTPAAPTGPSVGDAQFAAAHTSGETSIVISAPSVRVGSEATITAVMYVDGHPLGGKLMTLFIDGLAVDAKRSAARGTAVFTVSGLSAGTHSVAVSFLGAGAYASSDATSSITITQ
jgi:hypothetical protein